RVLGLADPVNGVRVSPLARLARALAGIRGDAASLLLGLRLDVGRALLGRLHDRPNLLGRSARQRRGGRPLLALELGDSVPDLAQVPVDLVRVVSAPRRGEVVALD